jgi:hypothetical protein
VTRTGSVRVEVLGRGGVEEPAELLDLVGCAVVALWADRGVGDGGRVEHAVSAWIATPRCRASAMASLTRAETVVFWSRISSA